MDEQMMQAPPEDMTHDMSDDDIAASLGFATTLGQGMLPQDDETIAEGDNGETSEDSPTEPEMKDEPGGEVAPEAQNDKVLSEIQGLRDELKVIVAPKSVEQEVADIRKELESLKNEPNREDTSTGE